MNGIRKFYQSTILLALLALIGVTAQAQLIDDFTGGAADLTNYTETVVNANNVSGGTAPTFSVSSSPAGLQVTGGGTQVMQTLFLRSDYSLPVGGTLTVAILNLGTSTFNADFGISVAAQANPFPSSPADARSNEVSIYIKPGSSEIGLNAFDGRTQLSSIHNTTASQGNSFLSLTGLWISQPTAHSFNVGYTTTLSNFTYRTGIALTNGSPGDAMVGSALGFWADVRSASTSPATLTNLAIIPEPSALALIGIGLGFTAVLLRRKRA